MKYFGGRHATKYYGDGATMGYVPSTDPLSSEYDPNPYASLSPTSPPGPQSPPPPSEPSLLKSPSPPEPLGRARPMGGDPYVFQ